jgi:hypothetical protein
VGTASNLYIVDSRQGTTRQGLLWLMREVEFTWILRSRFAVVQDKVSQALEQSMLARALSTNRVHDLLIAEAARKERKEASSKIVQKYSEIYSYQARREIALDEENKKEVVNIRNNQLSKPWRRNIVV